MTFDSFIRRVGFCQRHASPREQASKEKWESVELATMPGMEYRPWNLEGCQVVTVARPLMKAILTMVTLSLKATAGVSPGRKWCCSGFFELPRGSAVCRLHHLDRYLSPHPGSIRMRSPTVHSRCHWLLARHERLPSWGFARQSLINYNAYIKLGYTSCM